MMHPPHLINSIIDEYKLKVASTPDKSNVELEVRFAKISKDVFVDIYAQLLKLGYSGRLEQSINTITSNAFERSDRALPRNTQYIRHMEFNGKSKVKDEYTTKLPIRDMRARGYLDHKVAISLESPSKPFAANQNAHMRFKIRVEFTHKDFPDWRIDLTATKSARLSDIGKEVATIKDNLFDTKPAMNVKNMTDVINFKLIDEFEIEIEYIGDAAALTPQSIADAITRIYMLINPKYQTEVMYQEEIYNVAKKIVKNERIHHLYKSQYGMKQLANPAIALMKTTYKDIFPPVGYYLTEKADGVRCIVSIANGRCRLIADTLIDYPTDVQPTTICDAELVRGGGDAAAADAATLLIFDVMWYDGKDLTEMPFSERYDYLADATTTVGASTPNNVKCVSKNFVQLTEDNLAEAFKSVYEADHPYGIDGLIITSPDSSYKDTKNFKWKQMSQNTIDFLAIKCPKSMLGGYPAKAQHTLHLLFVGITPVMQSQLGLDLLPEYKQLFPDIDVSTAQHYPIQFATSDYPLAYLYYHPNNGPNINGKIVELTKDVKGNDKGKAKSIVKNATDAPWKLLMIREDRTFEHNYFGNNYKIADIIWQNFVAPFEFEDLWSLNVGYFQNIKSDTYRALTAYHSFIKSDLTRRHFENKKWIIDLASGRGADLGRYQQASVQNTIFIDSDRVALTEIINRKYHMIETGRNKRHARVDRDAKPMIIHILVANLTDDATDIYKRIGAFTSNPVDGVACHFAIHYLCDTIPHIRNLLSLVHQSLAHNGVFVFTTMSGERVFDKLANYKNNETWELKENNVVKFAIRKKYSGAKLSDSGQIISVKLPFAQEFYDEPLANIAMIIENAESMGFELVANVPFETRMKDFERANKRVYQNLTAADIEYSKLHQYVVLKKIELS